MRGNLNFAIQSVSLIGRPSPIWITTADENIFSDFKMLNLLLDINWWRPNWLIFYSSSADNSPSIAQNHIEIFPLDNTRDAETMISIRFIHVECIIWDASIQDEQFPCSFFFGGDIATRGFKDMTNGRERERPLAMTPFVLSTSNKASSAAPFLESTSFSLISNRPWLDGTWRGIVIVDLQKRMNLKVSSNEESPALSSSRSLPFEFRLYIEMDASVILSPNVCCFVHPTPVLESGPQWSIH